MRDLPAYYTVVGYADLDDSVETFTEIVFALSGDAWAVAVERAMGGDPTREFINQATEISTFVGICVEQHAGHFDLPRELPGDMKLDPDVDTMYDLQVYRRTYPGVATEDKPDPAPVLRFHWYDEERDVESAPFDTYAAALSDRYDAV